MAYNLPIIVATAPEGFCEQLTGPDWVQILFNEMLGRSVAQLEGSGFSVVLNQETQPDPDQQTALWYQPSTGRVYSFDGAWVSPHPSAPSGDERRWFAGILGATGLDLYDGGSVGPVGDNSGPMWEEDPDFRGRSPMGPGNIPTATPAFVIGVGVNYGEGSHSQAADEVGAHAHPLGSDASVQNGDNVLCVSTGAGGAGLQRGDTGPPLTDLSVQNNEFTTTQQPMPVLHPIRGLYCVMRTARLNFVGS